MGGVWALTGRNPVGTVKALVLEFPPATVVLPWIDAQTTLPRREKVNIDPQTLVDAVFSVKLRFPPRVPFVGNVPKSILCET